MMRSRFTVGLGVVLVGGALSLALAGCSDGPDATEESDKSEPAVQIAPDLVAQSWPVQMCDDAKRTPFENHPGWVALFKRDLPRALAAFQADPGSGRGLSRVHGDLAAVYSQATRLGAHATNHIYGADRQETDPVESAYLYGVSRGVLGDCSESAEALARLEAPGDSISAHHSFWTARAMDAACPVAVTYAELQGLPGAPSNVEPGSDPEIPPLPHYTFSERSADVRDVASGELTHLLALASGHRAAALAAAPELDTAVVHARLMPWQLPIEPVATVAAELPEPDVEWLFLDFALVGADLWFLDAAKRDGLSAVTTWKDRSLLAAALAPAVTPEGLDVEQVIDRAVDLRLQIKSTMAIASGSVQSYHPVFSQMGELAVLRAGMLVADANGQYRDAGILRINAFERSDGPSRDPVFLISTAAWDAGNRSPLRAQEIVHGLVSRYPSIRAARYPLDALHIRLGRTAAPTTAVH
jgi:hypothetical protein